jgi:hypothetical protein
MLVLLFMYVPALLLLLMDSAYIIIEKDGGWAVPSV